MIRAGVFIGVGKSGNLQRLQDAAAGARRMHAWALRQGMQDQVHAKLITDAQDRKVTPDEIYDAIKEILDGPGADQLIVYFAGHGVNILRKEIWLLTEAPDRTSAAVDVTSSVELARYCGVQHVVIISDACRVAPEGIKALSVKGQDIFPNDGGGERAKPVDQFYACLLGRAAAEIKDPVTAAKSYSALYTDALLVGLDGMQSDLLEASGVTGDSARYVKARPLKKYLERELPARIRARKLHTRFNQEPDAIITSDEEWLSRVQIIGAPPVTRELPDIPLPDWAGYPPDGVPSARVPTQRDAIRELTHAAAEGTRSELRDTMERLTGRAPAVGADFAHTVATVARPFDPDRLDFHCGIKVRGARITDIFAPRASAVVLNNEVVRVDELPDGAASILVQLDGGFGTVVPAIADFVAGLTFVEGELVDVAYEPSANSWRWSLFVGKADELRALRAVAASSSRHGRFELEGEEVDSVARRMQLAKGVDPTLAVYAAYAYYDLQHVERIRDMSDYLYYDVGARLFDLELLGRRLIGTSIGAADPVVPFLPLLTQGWALLQAHRVTLHPALRGIERTMRDSVWSLYGPDGLGRIRDAMASGEVR